jgi:hypothetical protein
MTAWIEMIQDQQASPELAEALERVRTPAGTVDNVMRVHSLRPQTMLGHWTLYMSVLHNDDNALSKEFLEVVASYTSILNRCDYPIVANPDGSPIPVGASLLANLMGREKERFASKLAPTVQVVNLTARGV